MRTALFYSKLYDHYADIQLFRNDLLSLDQTDLNSEAIDLLHLIKRNTVSCPITKSIIRVGERNTINALRQLCSANLKNQDAGYDAEPLIVFFLAVSSEIEAQLPASHVKRQKLQAVSID